MEKTIRQIAREKAVIAGRSAEQFCYWLIDTVMENKGSYEALLNTKLKKGWSFERLNKMEQSILLVATCELLESELDKSIVINEAVINAVLTAIE